MTSAGEAEPTRPPASVTVVGVKTPVKPTCVPEVNGSFTTQVDRNSGFCGRHGTNRSSSTWPSASRTMTCGA